MASNREDAKGAITSKSKDDPELESTLNSAHRLQLETKRDEHGHKERMRAKELGWLGRALGGEKSLPGSVAFLAMLTGLVGAGVCLSFAYNPKTLPPDATLAAVEANRDFWTDQLERFLAFSSAALAFIFGRGSK